MFLVSSHCVSRACNIFEERQTFGSSKRWSHCVVITQGYFLSGDYISWGHLPPPPRLPGLSTAVSMLNLVRHYQNPASHQHQHNTHSALLMAKAGCFIHDLVWIKSPRSFELTVQESQLQFLVSSWHTHQVFDHCAAGCCRLNDVETLTSVELRNLT